MASHSSWPKAELRAMSNRILLKLNVAKQPIFHLIYEIDEVPMKLEVLKIEHIGNRL